MDLITLGITLLLCLVISLYTVIYLFSHNPRPPFKSELFYITNDSKKEQFALPERITESSKFEYKGIDLSVIIPCYNETKRLKVMLEECITYLKENYPGKFEILIVDDQSSDGTAEYALTLADEFNLKPHEMKVVKFIKNRGKGGAVTHGLLYSSGKYALFADADGASKFSDISKLIEFFDKELISEPGVAIGSRAHMVNTDAVVKRSFIRNFLMHGLHTLVYVFGIRQVKDTQCGFKLFNHESISKIFPHMHTERWIFDVEVLLLATIQNIKIREVPINWQEIDGSKVDLAKDSIEMAIDLIVTRIAYIIGIYRLDKEKRVIPL